MERLLSAACARSRDTSAAWSYSEVCGRTSRTECRTGSEKASYYSQYKHQRHRWRVFSRLVETITAPAVKAVLEKCRSRVCEVDSAPIKSNRQIIQMRFERNLSALFLFQQPSDGALRSLGCCF